MKKFICKVCGYVHEGDSAPEICPLCGVDASQFEELKEAIDLIVHGESFIQKELLPLLNSKIEKKNEELDKIKSLTKRELEVLKSIASGNSNREIATTLEISERTVKNHIFNIFKKIEVSDRTQAAVFAIRNLN